MRDHCDDMPQREVCSDIGCKTWLKFKERQCACVMGRGGRLTSERRASVGDHLFSK